MDQKLLHFRHLERGQGLCRLIINKRPQRYLYYKIKSPQLHFQCSSAQPCGNKGTCLFEFIGGPPVAPEFR